MVAGSGVCDSFFDAVALGKGRSLQRIGTTESMVYKEERDIQVDSTALKKARRRWISTREEHLVRIFHWKDLGDEPKDPPSSLLARGLRES